MMAQLGSRACLHILERRELENYLIDSTAALRLINQKNAQSEELPGNRHS
jgi:hypothetical protein